MNTPKVNSKWLGQNNKAYTVIHIANTDGAPSLTPITVVYTSSTGVFTRPLRSWYNSMTEVK